MDKITEKLTEENLEHVSGGKTPIGHPRGEIVIYSVLRCKRCNSEIGRAIKQEGSGGCIIPECCPYCLQSQGIFSNDYYSVDEEGYL